MKREEYIDTMWNKKSARDRNEYRTRPTDSVN